MKMYVLGLWLGGSIIVIIHIPVFIASAIYRYVAGHHLMKSDWFFNHKRHVHDVEVVNDILELSPVIDRVSMKKVLLFTNILPEVSDCIYL